MEGGKRAHDKPDFIGTVLEDYVRKNDIIPKATKRGWGVSVEIRITRKCKKGTDSGNS